jgi:hypothetical protein
MAATGFLSDDVIEAIVDGRPLDGAWTALSAFAGAVRSLGDGPAPRPSPELATLLAGTRAPGTDTTERIEPIEPTERIEPIEDVDPTITWPSGPHDPTERFGVRGVVLRGGRRRVGKVALGMALVVAGVTGAGAGGLLPAAATDAVREAIEAVSPVRFADQDQAPAGDDHGPEAPPGTRGEPTPPPTTPAGDDAKPHGQDPNPKGNPRSNAPDEPPGQTGDTGMTRADEGPAAPHAPGSSPSATAPAHGRP